MVWRVENEEDLTSIGERGSNLARLEWIWRARKQFGGRRMEIWRVAHWIGEEDEAPVQSPVVGLLRAIFLVRSACVE
jgi:hypothetical protein